MLRSLFFSTFFKQNFVFMSRLYALSPGCISIVCAHGRAWEFYGESVYPGNEENFLAAKCTSLTALNMNLCPGKRHPMGYAVDKHVKGNLFLETNSNSPYGKSYKGAEKFACNAIVRSEDVKSI